MAETRKRSTRWQEGFADGYLACLHAFTGHHDGADTEFVEAVRCWGDGADLLRRAIHNDDIVLPHLRKAMKVLNKSRLVSVHGSSSVPRDGGNNG